MGRVAMNRLPITVFFMCRGVMFVFRVCKRVEVAKIKLKLEISKNALVVDMARFVGWRFFCYLCSDKQLY
jgi:hypothetical protein